MKLRVYRAADGWRWRLKARNGRIIADSGEAYTRRSDCVKVARKIASGPITVIVDES